MTISRHCVVRGRVLPAIALAGILLAGCASGHVGDDWQCPLATGGACDSVAAADPAVPDARAGKAMALGQPLWLLPRESGAADVETPPARRPGQAPGAPSCTGECGFDPFGWLARLFAGMGAEKTDPATAGAAPPAIPPRNVEARAAEPSADALPAEPDAGDGDSGAGSPADTATVDDSDTERAADLRTGEAVARIWIAPFVDADGIYREAAWVRVVLAPAGWRLR